MSRRLIPALVVAALGALACTDTKSPPPAPTTALADSADQIMFHARSVMTDRGVLRADLLADTAYFFDENTRIEMRTVNTTFFTVTGAKNAVLTSREGTYNTRQNGMEARGNVVVVSEDGRRLTTSQLRYDQQKNEISSDSSFVFTEPGRRLEGVGFTSDPDMTRMRCLASCRGTAGQVNLPAENAPQQRPPAGGTFRLPGEASPSAPPAGAGGAPAPVRPVPTRPAPPGADTSRPAAPPAGTFRLPGEGSP
jgi:LPS export ABC transporter protein LptC